MAEQEAVESHETIEPGSMPDEDLDKALTSSDTQTETTETETTGDKTAAATTTTPATETTPVVSEEEKLRKQIKDKQDFIDRQAREIGDRRQREQSLLSEIQAHKEALKTIWATDPLGALDLTKEITAKETELQNSQMETHTTINKQAVTTHVPDFDSYLPEIQKLLLDEDKLPKDVVDRWMQNPYVEGAGMAVALAKRAQAYKRLAAKDTEIATLKAEIETLKKQPEEIVKKIEQAARQQTPITAKTGRSTSEKGIIDERQIAELSDDEIETLMKEGGGD